MNEARETGSPGPSEDPAILSLMASVQELGADLLSVRQQEDDLAPKISSLAEMQDEAALDQYAAYVESLGPLTEKIADTAPKAAVVWYRAPNELRSKTIRLLAEYHRTAELSSMMFDVVRPHLKAEQLQRYIAIMSAYLTALEMWTGLIEEFALEEQRRLQSLDKDEDIRAVRKMAHERAKQELESGSVGEPMTPLEFLRRFT